MHIASSNCPVLGLCAGEHTRVAQSTVFFEMNRSMLSSHLLAKKRGSVTRPPSFCFVIRSAQALLHSNGDGLLHAVGGDDVDLAGALALGENPAALAHGGDLLVGALVAECGDMRLTQQLLGLVLLDHAGLDLLRLALGKRHLGLLHRDGLGNGVLLRTAGGVAVHEDAALDVNLLAIHVHERLNAGLVAGLLLQVLDYGAAHGGILVGLNDIDRRSTQKG